MCLTIYGITAPKYSTETLMITVIIKKITNYAQKELFSKVYQYRHICSPYVDGMDIFCSVLLFLKSVSNNASLLVMLPKSVQRHFQRGRRRGMQTYLYKFVEIPDYLFDMTWQKFHQIK